MEDSKLVHTLILDAGPIIKNEPPVSTLLASSHEIITLPSIINEIRDAATRSRLWTTLKPFLTLREPKAESVRFIQDFARRTGDLSVLSRPDVLLLALAYEVECERNGGDWRLRRVPGQKRLNGSPPKREEDSPQQVAGDDAGAESQEAVSEEPKTKPFGNDTDSAEKQAKVTIPATNANLNETSTEAIETTLAETTLSNAQNQTPQPQSTGDDTQRTSSIDNANPPDSDSDSEGWITASNLHEHQARDAGASLSNPNPASQPKTMQVATLTTDFAMQNVLLQTNLNLLSPSLHRVRHLKTFIKRCHACFLQVKDMSKEFCPRCGKDTLTKVACSTNQDGVFQLHLKRNMQWNTRGNRYSIPKAVPGSSSGKVEGGGKGGWGNGLILAEDQKEYVRAVGEERRRKEKDLMDDDFLPSILSGDRGRTGGRPKVGAGRNVNSKKR